MQVIKCFSVEVWDGGSMHNHKFYVASEDEAKKWTAKNTYDTYFAKTFVVFDTLEEAMDNDTKKVKARALAKLTALERQALGYPA